MTPLSIPAKESRKRPGGKPRLGEKEIERKRGKGEKGGRKEKERKREGDREIGGR
jgi:hypothetical protein